MLYVSNSRIKSSYNIYKASFALKYTSCTGCLQYDKKYGCPQIKPYIKFVTKDVESFVDGIIPLAYEYQNGYKDHPKRKNTIYILGMHIDQFPFMFRFYCPIILPTVSHKGTHPYLCVCSP